MQSNPVGTKHCSEGIWNFYYCTSSEGLSLVFLLGVLRAISLVTFYHPGLQKQMYPVYNLKTHGRSQLKKMNPTEKY